MKNRIPKTKPQLYLVHGNQEAKQESSFISSATTANIIHVDKAGFLQYANDEAIKQLGISKNSRLNEISLFDIDSALTPDSWKDFLEVMNQHTAISYDCQYRSVSGDFLPVHCIAEHQIGATIVTVYFTNIEKVVSEVEELRHKVQIYESFFNTPFLDINIKDKDGYYIATSEKFEKTSDSKKATPLARSPMRSIPLNSLITLLTTIILSSPIEPLKPK
ncbi:MAG: hypothetical protein GKR95_04335 [Gammaproteobacteria bacterium]|nr:hypothetical protein [Gammaproteobacteria bacterium]